MADAPKPAARPSADTTELWTGTGLCCEAQGDGVPCEGTDGECEFCGRALPPDSPREAADPTSGDRSSD